MSQVPPEFECPITLTIMLDPVLGDDGQTYERAAIEHWLSTNSNRSPITRMPMRIDTLRTNFALKSQIDRYLASTPAQAGTVQQTPKPFVSAALTLSASTARGHDSHLLNVVLTPPPTGTRQPVLMFLNLDVSGSMQGDCGADVEDGAAAFTILDLCKHTVRTIANMLGPDDMLCLITYSSAARVVMKPTFMDDAGKAKLEEQIRLVRADGNTNIWSSLELMDRIASGPEFANSNIVAALLTDGVSNMNPGRGVLESFKLYGKPKLYNLSTFGFGYHIDSKLLADLASFSGGSFAFCPDFSMVATVFINWAATTLSSAAKSQQLSITYDGGRTTQHNTGIIQFGQPRIMTLPLDGPRVFSVSLGAQTIIPTELEALPLIDVARFELCRAIKHSVDNQASTSMLAGLYAKYAGTEAAVLMSDVKPAGHGDEGQVMMATSMALREGGIRFYERWGQHYMPAYLRAQELQQRMNFKDPGLQGYGGEMFNENQTLGDHVFGSLTPLEPTGMRKGAAHSSYGGYGVYGSSTPSVSRAPPVSLASLNNATYGGCWAAGSLIEMADGSKKPIEDVRKGDMVWTISGGSPVQYALELGTKQTSQPMVLVGDLWITPWHPILVNNSWQFPASLAPISERMMPKVYNLVIGGGRVVRLNDVLTVSLGHGLTGPVIEHAFFGNKELILRDIAKQPGFAEGRPVFQNLKVRKDEAGLICGWYDDI